MDQSLGQRLLADQSEGVVERHGADASLVFDRASVIHEENMSWQVDGDDFFVELNPFLRQ